MRKKAGTPGARFVLIIFVVIVLLFVLIFIARKYHQYRTAPPLVPGGTISDS